MKKIITLWVLTFVMIGGCALLTKQAAVDSAGNTVCAKACEEVNARVDLKSCDALCVELVDLLEDEVK